MNTEFDKELYELGKKALVKELGLSGAMEFLRISSRTAEEEGSENLGPLKIDVTASIKKQAVLLKFNYAVSWIRLNLEQVEKLVTTLNEIMRPEEDVT